MQSGDHAVKCPHLLVKRSRPGVCLCAAGIENSCMLLQQDFVMRLQLGSTNNGAVPTSALNVQGGQVTSVTPVTGFAGQLYDVGVRSNLRDQAVTISTAAGHALASGLALAQSNQIIVQVEPTGPQVSQIYSAAVGDAMRLQQRQRLPCSDTSSGCTDCSAYALPC